MPPVTARSSRRQARQESRQAILDAAEKRLRTGRFHEVSVDLLMGDTGLGRTVFYRHFADLPDLVLQLLQSVGAELMTISERWAAGADSQPIGRESIGLIVDFWSRNGTFIRAVSDAARLDPEIEQVYDGIVDRFVEMTAAPLTALGTVENPRETARALTAMNEHYLLGTFGVEPPRATPEEAIDALWGVWRRTIYRDQEE
jgi:AcrR family transcriptional regulator